MSGVHMRSQLSASSLPIPTLAPISVKGIVMNNRESGDKQVLLDELEDLTNKMKDLLDEYQEELKHHETLFIENAIQAHQSTILIWRRSIDYFKSHR